MQKLTRIGSGGNFLQWSVLIFQFCVNFICLGSGSSWRTGEAAFTHSEPFLLWNEKLAQAGSQERTSCLVYQNAIKSSYFFSPFLSVCTAEKQRVLLFFFFFFSSSTLTPCLILFSSICFCILQKRKSVLKWVSYFSCNVHCNAYMETLNFALGFRESED